MRKHSVAERSSQFAIFRNAIVGVVVLFIALCAAPPSRAQCQPGQPVPGQAAPVADWEAAAGGKMSFDVASIKPDNSNDPQTTTSSFPLGPGNVYATTGGRFCATNFPLLAYIVFAYKVTDPTHTLTGVPDWAGRENFDIVANGPSSATKDQMRLMMQSLLAERFKLTVHKETQQKPGYELVVAKPGKLGPQLQVYLDEGKCAASANGASLNGPATPPAAPAPPSSSSGTQLPPIPCGGILGLPPSAQGSFRLGAKNIPLALLAKSITNGLTGIDRPVVDHTGLTGNFDFSLEFSPPSQSPDTPADESGPSFLQALQDQLGLKLNTTTVPVNVLVLDHIEQPSQN